LATLPLLGSVAIVCCCDLLLLIAALTANRELLVTPRLGVVGTTIADPRLHTDWLTPSGTARGFATTACAPIIDMAID
jgi:hypothetical protein